MPVYGFHLPPATYSAASSLLSAMPRRRIRNVRKVAPNPEAIAQQQDEEMAERILEASRKAELLVSATERYLKRCALYHTVLDRLKQESPQKCATLQQAVQAFVRAKAEQHSIPYHPNQPEQTRQEVRARILKRLTDTQSELRRITAPAGCEQSIQLVLAASTGVLLAHATVH